MNSNPPVDRGRVSAQLQALRDELIAAIRFHTEHADSWEVEDIEAVGGAFEPLIAQLEKMEMKDADELAQHDPHAGDGDSGAAGADSGATPVGEIPTVVAGTSPVTMPWPALSDYSATQLCAQCGVVRPCGVHDTTPTGALTQHFVLNRADTTTAVMPTRESLEAQLAEAKQAREQAEQDQFTLHQLLSDVYSLTDPGQYPDLCERIGVVLDACKNGQCHDFPKYLARVQIDLANAESALQCVEAERDSAQLHATVHQQGADILAQSLGEARDQLATLQREADQLRAALRKLMKESAAVLALATPELRDALGHTNVSVFKLRIDEAAELLAPSSAEGEPKE